MIELTLWIFSWIIEMNAISSFNANYSNLGLFFCLKWAWYWWGIFWVISGFQGIFGAYFRQMKAYFKFKRIFRLFSRAYQFESPYSFLIIALRSTCIGCIERSMLAIRLLGKKIRSDSTDIDHEILHNRNHNRKFLRNVQSSRSIDDWNDRWNHHR